MIRFKANGQRLSMMKIDLVADTIDYLTAEFEFIGWEKFPVRVAHFRNGDAVYDIVLTDDRILESDHLNLSAGIWNVYLHGNNGSSRITTNPVYFRVQETGILNGEPMPEIPLSTAEQILQTAKNAEDTANAVAADAAAGKFNGKDGEPGPRGESGRDGYTPVKGVDYFDGEKGEKGNPGNDGYTPVRGVDYFTDADKEELVNAVLSALPAAEGVSY